MPGVKNLTIFVLLWLQLKQKVNIVFSMEAKTHLLNAFPKKKLFSFLIVVSNQKKKIKEK